MMNLEQNEKKKAFQYLYSHPLLSRVQNWGHIITEQFLQNRGYILDLGSGTGEHSYYATDITRYIALDCDRDVLLISRENCQYYGHVQALAEYLPFKKDSFAGIVSVYNLEHIHGLDHCITECHRILKSDGCLAIALPTEGFLFRMGRKFFTGRHAIRELGFSSIWEYEEYVRSEHINSFHKILSIVKKSFSISKISWYPMRIPSKDININIAFQGVKKREI